MRFGKTPLPSAAPGITSVQSKAVPRTQHLQGDHTNSFTQSHSPRICDYKTSRLIEKNRPESDNVAVSRSPALGRQGLTSVPGEVFGEALLKQEYFSIIELENTRYCGHLTEGKQKTTLQGKQPQTRSDRYTLGQRTETRATQGWCKARAWRSLCTK